MAVNMSKHDLKQQQKGIGLPEIMVAMLLLGVAVIGFAGLQVRALSSTNDAMYRTQAIAIAQDFAERMALNPTAKATYLNAWNASAVAANKCETGNCTDVQMAQYDMRTITNLAIATLPNGQIAVMPCIERNNVCIYVSWNSTTPTQGTAAPHCTVPIDDTYVTNADCVKLETL
jgi:type IV pilus assembly protein PilV